MPNQSKTALVTGGAKRIGREIILSLASKGYDIVFSYNNSAKEANNLVTEIEESLGKKCRAYKCDLCDIRQTQKLASYMTSNFPDWSLLVNNASIFEKTSFLQDDFLTKLEKNQNIHFTSPIILSQSFAVNVKNKNRKNAQIINLIDKNITRFETQYFFYNLSKKSLANLTQMLAIELSPTIRTNAIAPGVILTPTDNNQDLNPKNNPLAYEANIENVILALNYLLENKFVNGEILYVDGGANLNNQG